MPFVPDESSPPVAGRFVPDQPAATPAPQVPPPTGFRAMLGQAFNQTIGQMGGPLASVGAALMTPKAGLDTLEAAGTLASGNLAYLPSRAAGLAGIVGDATGIVPNDPAATEQKVANTLTYQPSDPNSLPSQVVALPGKMMSGAGDLLASIPGVQGTPYLESIVRRSPEALANAIGLYGLLKARAAANAPPTPAGNQQSVGASAAAANLEDASPELRTVAQKALQRGKFNDVAYNRQLEAESLPVPVKLMEGQATGDPTLISRDMNMRGKVPAIADRIAEQNKALAANLETIRDTTGEQVFSTNPVEHGDTIIGDYLKRDASAEGRVNQLYQRLRDASGGQFPVDAQQLLSNATDALHRKLLFDSAPPDIMRTLQRLADDGGMTFENFESLRTNLARLMRSPTADGNVKAAAGVIRDQMEQLPLQSGAADLKPLADQARSMAKQRFRAIEADPAYKAAVSGADPDRFVSKFIIRGARDDVATMMKDVSPETRQTIRVAVLDYLRQQAKLSAEYDGNFSAHGYNRALEGLSAKLPLIFEPQQLEQIRSLGNVARYVTEQPRGSSVNNSNTFVAGIADYSKGAAEGMANVAAGGVPVGTWTRRLLEKRGAAKTLQPGAGVMTYSEYLKRAAQQPPTPP